LPQTGLLFKRNHLKLNSAAREAVGSGWNQIFDLKVEGR
jgi:hypothetical protein